ncbi:hypothetical protein QOZ80_8BG0647150 [Eleusine coracana subsp. coracana]|nr:hypothetical protein QOZ80_8BG0647150 [Eleusine coracana subsp. coracana]
MQTRHPVDKSRRTTTTIQEIRMGQKNEVERKDMDHIAQFCGSAATGQGFYHIEDIPCEQIGKDMATLAMIVVKQGEVTARQIEFEFKTLAGEGSTWRWYAKKRANNQFQMRFLTTKKLEEISHFVEMRLRSVPSVVILIKRWKDGIGAKGKLEEAWFRIRGIPLDKRSVPNIKRVGSLIGLSLKVDEENVMKNEYVRVKTGCKNVAKVPVVVEGELGTYLYDFLFP